MKTMLITGANGLLGSACARRFTGEYGVWASGSTDLRDSSACRELISRFKPSVIINCAAKVGGIKANRDFPVEFIEDNLAIQANICNASHEFGVEKLVMVGTSCLYPKYAPIPVTEEMLLTGPFEPDVQAYAVAKLTGLELCKAYSNEYGKNFMCVAPCNLYGLGDNYGESAHVIPALIRRIVEAHKEKKPLVVWGDGTAIREFLYADDCANAIGYVIDKWNKPDLINIGSGLGTNIRTLVNTLIAVTNLDVEVQWDKTKPVGIQSKTLDNKKITKLGWGAETPLETGLLKAYLDFIENPHLRMK